MTSSNNLHQHQQLLELVQQGKRPVVRFTKGVLDAEDYPEPGMMARVIGASADGDETLKLRLDYAEFDAHNLALESPNYFDKHGDAKLTARQADQYKPQDILYLDLSGSGRPWISIQPEAAHVLYDRFRASAGADAGAGAYVSWLEETLLAAEEKLSQSPATSARLKP